MLPPAAGRREPAATGCHARRLAIHSRRDELENRAKAHLGLRQDLTLATQRYASAAI
jgi:hypothetical protein